MANVDRLLASLDKVKRTGEGRWVACCPAHADRSPSLSIRYIDDKVLLHCFGGCAVDEVVSSIGLTLTDLMPERVPFLGSKPVKTRIPASDFLEFIHHEATIVTMVAGAMMRGNTLSGEQFLRLIEAYEHLEDAVRECCR
jgi:hypothetical protein